MFGRKKEQVPDLGVVKPGDVLIINAERWVITTISRSDTSASLELQEEWKFKASMSIGGAFG